jgi:hypothetical protein
MRRRNPQRLNNAGRANWVASRGFSQAFDEVDKKKL